MNVQIRQATINDLDRLAPLFDSYRQFYGQASHLALAYSFLAERMALNESLILLASDAQGAPFGFTQLYPLFSSVSAVRTYLLNDLFVVAEARRHGVAKALMIAAAEQARTLGAASLSLATAWDNAPAQALYESLGWQRDQTFCDYSLVLT